MKKDRGFTIVELLVVIVVIGILAAITIVSYTGITSKANTASGQAEANSALAKVNAYNAETVYGYPTSYGSITGAASTATYSAPTLNFTTASNNKTMTDFRPAGIAPSAVDFSLCGTNAGAVPAAYSAITVPTGVKIGYWDYSGAGTLNDTINVTGTVSGGNVRCFKVGLAEAAMAVVRAMYTEAGNVWPTSAAAIQGNTALGAKLPPTLTSVSGELNGTALTSVNGLTKVNFNCINTGCPNGGRIMFWDYNTGALSTAANSLYYGGATSAGTFSASL